MSLILFDWATYDYVRIRIGFDFVRCFQMINVWIKMPQFFYQYHKASGVDLCNSHDDLLHEPVMAPDSGIYVRLPEQ
ncbi:hypothetical protein Hanom_Chr16g01452921 [Helianthus anomalus]